MNLHLDIPALLSELTLEEKASLLSGADFWHTQDVARMGIPSIMVTDGPHGLRKQAGASDHLGLNDSVPATCFPPAAGLASSWDRDLLARVGQALGIETRANGVAVLLGPGINIKRSPLCGRNFEYFSEDPYLAGELAAPMVEGIQSVGVGTSLKHFAVNNQETDRMRVSAEVDQRTLREIYLYAFETVVKRARPWTLMCAYNKINGTFASEDPWLLTEVLRDEWGYDGLVMSDWGAVNDRPAGVHAGLDLEMPSSAGIHDARIVAAVRSGDLSEADVDRAAARLLTLVQRSAAALAEPLVADLEAHDALAREVATRTAVLLKNDGALPLVAEQLRDVVVIGEMARTPRYQGAGSSLVNPYRLTSALDAFAARGIDVDFAPGYRLAEAAGAPGQERDDEALLAEAVELAEGRVALLFLGLPAVDESEGYDRTHMQLPESHKRLLAAVRRVARQVIVLLSNGSSVSVAEWDADADAILELWLGGQAGGAAAVDLLSGDAAPAGRLAESIPVRLADVPAQLNFPGSQGVVRYGEGIFVGYRGLDAMETEVAYPFGHGLTYTQFAYSNLVVDQEEVTSDTEESDVVIRVSVRVANTGDRAGVAVPQLYVGRPASAVARAPRELRGFEAVELAPGESHDVTFALTRRDLSHWDESRSGWVVEAGPLEVWVGASSRDLPLHATVDLAAPRLAAPLGPYSTVAEWLADPEARPEILARLSALGPEFTGEGGQVFMAQVPLIKVVMMGMTDNLTLADLDELAARYGA